MSLTIAGVFVSVLGSILGAYLSDGCAREVASQLVQYAPVAIGAAMSYAGRVRQGDVDVIGRRRAASTPSEQQAP